MKIDIARVRMAFAQAQSGKASRHDPVDRTRPRIWQYDYLTLSHLHADVQSLLNAVSPPAADARALDLGSYKSPYRSLLEARGFRVATLDLTRDDGADYAGTIERTGLPDASFDLVLCTQVIEHCPDPWAGLREVARILRPGGHILFSAPHVWFYHPHPTDHWRFTQEGMLQVARQAALVPVSLLAQGGTMVTLFQVVAFLAYGVFGRFGAPLFALLNVVALAADRVAPNALFAHNFALLARKDG